VTSVSVHPRIPHRPSHSASTNFRPRIHPSPIRRHAPTGSPLPQALDFVARRDSHGYDVLGGLSKRYVEERREPAARLDLSIGPVGVVGAGLLRVQAVVPRVDAPGRVFLVTPAKVYEEHTVELFH
jgi:hypothetical protein